MYALDISKDQWSFSIETITPNVAQNILDHKNYGNRKIRPSVVERYARIMLAGDWHLSPEAIVISKTGRLLNGQHRLSAVVKSGVTVQFLTIRGPADNVFSVLDRGAIRSTADALSSDRAATEVAKLFIRVTTGQGSASVNDFEVARVLQKISSVHADLISFCNTRAVTFTSAPFRLAAIARVMRGDSREYVFGLYRNLALADIDALPRIGVSAVKAQLTGRFPAGGASVQLEWLGYAWGLFDQMKQHNDRAQRPRTRDFVREIAHAVNAYKA